MSGGRYYCVLGIIQWKTVKDTEVENLEFPIHSLQKNHSITYYLPRGHTQKQMEFLKSDPFTQVEWSQSIKREPSKEGI